MGETGKIVMVTSGKGGSGKSTTAVNCGYALSQRGKKILLIDADAGLRALDLMLSVTDRVIYDLGDVLEGRCEPAKAIVMTDWHNLQLMSAPQSADSNFNPELFIQLCRGLSHYYDYVIIDSPAGLGLGVSSPAAAVDMALVVATPDPVCLRDADRVANVLRGCGVVSIRLVLNMIKPKLIRKGSMPDLDSAINSAALQLIGIVPEDDRISVASAAGRPVTLLKKGAAQAFRNIAARIDGEYVPLMKL